MMLAEAAAAVDLPGWAQHLPSGIAAFVGVCFLFQKPLGEWIASLARRRRGEAAEEPISIGRVVRELDQIGARLADLSVRFSEFGRRFTEHALEEASTTKGVHDGICDFEAGVNERLAKLESGVNERLSRLAAELGATLHAIEIRLAERGARHGG